MPPKSGIKAAAHAKRGTKRPKPGKAVQATVEQFEREDMGIAAKE